MSEAATFEPDIEGQEDTPAQQIERRSRRNRSLARSGLRMRSQAAIAGRARRAMRPSRKTSSAMARAGSRVARMTPVALLTGGLVAGGLSVAGVLSGKSQETILAEAKDFLYQGQDMEARASRTVREQMSGNMATALEAGLNGGVSARQVELRNALQQIELTRVRNQREFEKQFGVDNWFELMIKRIVGGIEGVLYSEDTAAKSRKVGKALQRGMRDRIRSADHKESPR